MTNKMRLYVWEDIFKAYTGGLAIAIAHSQEEAIEVILAKERNASLLYDKLRELRDTAPTVYSLNTPIGFHVEGGG